ncbi:fumarase fum1 [Exophiala xenobiotica]|nr:fumarase fum1 [Exophiala xenobiotica]
MATTTTRTETDAFGDIEVPADKYWGAQTQRSDQDLSTHSNHLTWKGLSSLQNFVINQPRDRMPDSVIRAYGILKGAAAAVNVRHGALGKPCLALPRLASDAPCPVLS